MKPKDFKKKLLLNKKTVVNLNKSEKQNVNGGAPETLVGTCSCYEPCDTLGNTCATYCGTCELTCDTCNLTCDATCTVNPSLSIAYPCTC